MALDVSKFLARFVDETREHCARISEGLINLEHAPDDAELINAVFRSAHTIKGSARMMKVAGVTELAHKMEDVLDGVRAGKIPLAPSVSDALFRGVDALSVLLEQVTAGNTSAEAPQPLCEELARAASVAGDSPETVPAAQEAGPAPTPASAPVEPPVQSAPSGATETTATTSAPADPVPTVPTVPPVPPVSRAKGGSAEYLRVNATKLDDMIRLMGEIVSEHGRFRKHIARLGELERVVARHTKNVAERLSGGGGGGGDDLLIEAGSNLQLSLRQSVRAVCDASLMQDHLVADLQETSLRMRMQPLSTVFDPLRRTVRDLAREQGKDIDFIVEGGDTELDRKIIDRIGDSLIHMIRNAMDHGVGTAEERSAAGKSPKGTIVLSAFYSSGCVTISLSDDGKGLSVDRIRDKALTQKLFTEEALAVMSKAEITNLIFMPGFSTSPIITDLSGRGVGMDVVRKSIVDELKGTIVIDTKEGVGTTFLLRLPLNLAVFTLFLFSVNGKTCAVSATSIVEMISVRREEIIDIVNKRAVRLREQIIPVEDLAALLGIPREAPSNSEEVLIAIVRDGEAKLGLFVDGIVGREEMVVKPLPAHLQGLRLVSGVTIGERDSVINVLHVPELFKKAHERTDPGRVAAPVHEERNQTVLVVDDSVNTREIEKSILEAYGYLVDTAEDGEDGFGKTRETLYDLVITDVEMPRLDGFSLTARLRGDERYRNVPIIIVTSLEKPEDKKRGIMVGANAYIVKGAFDQSNLLETVRSLIG